MDSSFLGHIGGCGHKFFHALGWQRKNEALKIALELNAVVILLVLLALSPIMVDVWLVPQMRTRCDVGSFD